MKKTLNIGHIMLATVMIAIAALTAYVVAPKAHGNPSAFIGPTQTAPATTTVTYMSAGTATTTLIIDAYGANTNTLSPFNQASLNVQFTGSSTASILNIAIEHARGDAGLNCATTPLSCDWYQDDVLTTAGAFVGTTSQTASISAPNIYTWSFSSTSPLGGVTQPLRLNKTVTVPLTSRYTRAVITMPAGSLAGAVWAEFQPIREVHE